MSSMPTNGHRILIAEDDSSIRELVESLLHTEGYETDGAATLPEALERIEENAYDLVLADLLTPNMQPPTLLNVQQLQQRCRPTPVGVVTGWRIEPKAAQRAGFAFFLEKPFDLDTLLQRIADSLNSPFTAEQAQQAHVIKRALQALSAGDWETLRALCTPTLCYYLLTRSVFTPERALIGIDAYLTYAQLLRSRLPGFRVDHAVIFQHLKGLITRYRTSWQAPDGEWLHYSNSAICRFQGERISQIGVAQPRTRVQALVEQTREDAQNP
ncbi:MAG TPA: response regulator [Ktedonobacterales bacterium]|jgi:CheY-like chemotaxis protein